MGHYLRNDEGQFLKEIDSVNSEITFTDKMEEAKFYGGGSWFAETELEYVKFHFKDRKEVETLQSVCL